MTARPRDARCSRARPSRDADASPAQVPNVQRHWWPRVPPGRRGGPPVVRPPVKPPGRDRERPSARRVDGPAGGRLHALRALLVALRTTRDCIGTPAANLIAVRARSNTRGQRTGPAGSPTAGTPRRRSGTPGRVRATSRPPIGRRGRHNDAPSTVADSRRSHVGRQPCSWPGSSGWRPGCCSACSSAPSPAAAPACAGRLLTPVRTLRYAGGGPDAGRRSAAAAGRPGDRSSAASSPASAQRRKSVVAVFHRRVGRVARGHRRARECVAPSSSRNAAGPG